MLGLRIDLHNIISLVCKWCSPQDLYRESVATRFEMQVPTNTELSILQSVIIIVGTKSMYIMLA